MKTFQEYLDETFRVPVKINSPGHPNHGKTGHVAGIKSADTVRVRMSDGSDSYHKPSELDKG